MRENQSALHYYKKFTKRFCQCCQYRPALFGCLAVFLCFLVVIRAYLNRPVGSGSTRTGNFTLSEHNFPSMLMTENKSSSQYFGAGTEQMMTQESAFICHSSNLRTDVCEMKGDVRVHGKSSKIVLVSSSEMNLLAENRTLKIRPYARKGATDNVNEMTLEPLTGEEHAPSCSLKHNVSAIVFSVTGFSGNYFHDFTDVLIPLFITAHHFHGEVQFLITNYQARWVRKYHVILEHLSKYEAIDLDHDDQVRCFPSAHVGLRFHKEMSIDPSRSPNGYSMYDFIRFLRSSYSLKRDTAIKLGDNEGKKPRLLIISRKGSRAITNLGEIEEMARELGYEVVIGEADFGEVSKFAHLVNSCDVMMGVHGAGLTNLVFLPANAVLIQVLPFGDTEWVSNTYFGEPSKDMKLRYIEYKIEEKESSLSEEYPHDHPVLRDPSSISKQGWQAFGSIYLDKQNVKLDVGRFRNTLSHALDLLHQ